MEVTRRLESRKLLLGKTWAQVMEGGGGSVAGFHANSDWLSCPEKMRLRAAGIVRRDDPYAVPGELNALDYGTLMHELLALRVEYGHQKVMEQLTAWRPEVGEATFAAASLMLGTYDMTFPLATDPLRYLGVEAEVVTDVGQGQLRTVRYDAVVQAPTPGGSWELYSLERKTMSRGGQSALHAYYAQGMSQVALWNSNEGLVALHGEMKGVIYESLIKTKTPSVDRTPVYFSKRQQRLALDYLASSTDGAVTFKQRPDGSFPRMLHACWGRFAPCPYVGLCHDELEGEYVRKDGSPL